MTHEFEKRFIDKLSKQTRENKLEWSRLSDGNKDVMPNVDCDKSFESEIRGTSVVLASNKDGIRKCFICQNDSGIRKETQIGQHCGAELIGLYKCIEDRLFPTAETFMRDFIDGVFD